MFQQVMKITILVFANVFCNQNEITFESEKTVRHVHINACMHAHPPHMEPPHLITALS